MELEASFTSRLLHGQFWAPGYQGMPLAGFMLPGEDAGLQKYLLSQFTTISSRLHEVTSPCRGSDARWSSPAIPQLLGTGCAEPQDRNHP